MWLMLLSPAYSLPNYTSVDKQSKEQRDGDFVWRKMEQSANKCQEAPAHVIMTTLWKVLGLVRGLVSHLKCCQSILALWMAKQDWNKTMFYYRKDEE